MNLIERIGLGAALTVWEALWLFRLVMAVKFFNVPPPPSHLFLPNYCAGPSCIMQALDEKLAVLPLWVSAVSAIALIVAGAAIWTWTEHGSRLRNLASIVLGGTTAILLGWPLSAASTGKLPLWVQSSDAALLCLGAMLLPLLVWLEERYSPEVQR